MKAFLNDPKVKKTYLARIKAHRLADEIVKGQYWEDGKGCAVGCTIHSSKHSAYETELGIPEWLARVEDTIFEGLENKRAKKWPEEFLSSIKVGADLSKIKAPFIIYVLQSSLRSLAKTKLDSKAFPEVAKAIVQTRVAVKEMIRLHKVGVTDLRAAESAAESAAENAAWNAASAAWSAAESAAASAAWNAAASAAASAAWNAAESAAESAARSAACAARSAACAARSAAESAAWGAAASAAESAAESAARSAACAAWSAVRRAAWSAARRAAWSAAERAAWNAAESAAASAEYEKFADKLLELLRECK